MLINNSNTLARNYQTIYGFFAPYFDDDEERNVTYSYKDVLTGTVELDVFDGESYSPLIPPIVDVKKKKIL